MNDRQDACASWRFFLVFSPHRCLLTRRAEGRNVSFSKIRKTHHRFPGNKIHFQPEKLYICKQIIIMTITIETSGIQEVEQLLKVLKSLNIKNVKVTTSLNISQPVITKGNKNLDATTLFGIWKDNPRTIEAIRSNAWKRDWDI